MTTPDGGQGYSTDATPSGYQAAPAGGYGAYGGQPSSPRNGLGIASLVLGILAVLGFFFVVPALLGIVAIILGVVAGGKARRGEAGGEGLAKTGMILGIAGVALSILLPILPWAGMSFLGSKAEQFQKDMEQKAREMEQQQQVDDTSATPTTVESAP